MQDLKHLFDANKNWSQSVLAADGKFFSRLAEIQAPEYLWIGCADSRVPANEIVGLRPGELFVHRNVANLVVHTDLNCLSVMQYAVDVLKVKHIIVCGHYGCGGVAAAMQEKELGLIDNWLRHIQDVRYAHMEQLAAINGTQAKVDRLCELNVIEQVTNTCRTTIVRDAWRRGQELTVHGWIYGLKDGLLRDLDMRVRSSDEVHASYFGTIETSRSTRQG
ncbi:MAG: carbonate dehydratase [Pirellulales bacterium]|nr:carbonate dehydratase [Planctomycetales bacterium]